MKKEKEEECEELRSRYLQVSQLQDLLHNKVSLGVSAMRKRRKEYEN